MQMMLKASILLAVLAVGFALPLDSDLDSQWEAFKSFHGKKYAVSQFSPQYPKSICMYTYHMLS